MSGELASGGLIAMLATAGHNGALQTLLSGPRLRRKSLMLVDRGLATLTAEKVRAGGKLIAVARARITDAGREALER
jgi:hypothetical protein